MDKRLLKLGAGSAAIAAVVVASLLDGGVDDRPEAPAANESRVATAAAVPAANSGDPATGAQTGEASRQAAGSVGDLPEDEPVAWRNSEGAEMITTTPQSAVELRATLCADGRIATGHGDTAADAHCQGAR